MRAAFLALPFLVAADCALGHFHPLRYEENSFDQRQACADANRIVCFKARPITDDIRVSVGGALRWHYEHVGNPRYGDDPQDRWGALLQRHSAFADLQVGAQLRGFVQLTTSLASGRAAAPSPLVFKRQWQKRKSLLSNGSA